MVIIEIRSIIHQYVAPHGSKFATIMPGKGHEITIFHHDILINLHDGGLKTISNVHRSYMPFVYVLLFPRGEDGWDYSSPYTKKQCYSYWFQVGRDTLECLL